MEGGRGKAENGRSGAVSHTHRTLKVACMPGARLPASVGYESSVIEKKREEGGRTLTRRVRFEVLWSCTGIS